MAPPKAKTRMQAMGFSDPDLKDPNHDELIAMFLENGIGVLSELIANPYAELAPEGNVKLEVPIKDRNFIVGFVDLVYTTKQVPAPFVAHYMKTMLAIQEEYKDAGELIADLKKAGYDVDDQWVDKAIGKGNRMSFPRCGGDYKTPYYVLDINKNSKTYLTVSKDTYGDLFPYDEDFKFVIEFKTKIPSMGELLRQMNTYREYINDRYYSKRYIVVTYGACPYSKIIRSQGIHVIEYINGQWLLNDDHGRAQEAEEDEMLELARQAINGKE